MNMASNKRKRITQADIQDFIDNLSDDEDLYPASELEGSASEQSDSSETLDVLDDDLEVDESDERVPVEKEKTSTIDISLDENNYDKLPI